MDEARGPSTPPRPRWHPHVDNLWSKEYDGTERFYEGRLRGQRSHRAGRFGTAETPNASGFQTNSSTHAASS